MCIRDSQILLGNAHQPLTQLGRQLRRQRRLIQPAFIEQLIEQQRVAGYLLGNPGAGGAERDKSLQRSWVFSHKHQVGRAPGNLLYQRQHPFQHQIRLVVLDGMRQQARNKGIQTLAPEPLHGTHLRPVAQIDETPIGRDGLDKAGLLQLQLGSLIIQCALP